MHNPLREAEAGRFMVTCEHEPPLEVSLDGQPLATSALERQHLVGAGFEIMLGPGERRRLKLVLPVQGHAASDHGERGFLYRAQLPPDFTEGTLLAEVPKGYRVRSEPELHPEGQGRHAGRVVGHKQVQVLVMPSWPKGPMILAVGVPVAVFLLAAVWGARSRTPALTAGAVALLFGVLAFAALSGTAVFRWSTYPLARSVLGVLAVASGPAAAAVLAEAAAALRRSADPTVENSSSP